MDYILQTEKIFKFLELNLELEEMKNMMDIKKDFCNDLNLIGCFLKDILNLENSGINSEDENIYSDFVLCFEKHNENNESKEFIQKLKRYSKHYRSLVFEETDVRVLLTAIATINSCCAIEYYPFMMELMDEFLCEKINRIHFMLMLQLITDMVISNFDKDTCGFVDLLELRAHLEEIKTREVPERLAV